MNRFIVGLMSLLVTTMVLSSGAKELPAIRNQGQLNEEAGIWIAAIEKVMASGKNLRVENDGKKETLERLVDILGPHMPVKKVEFLELGKDGSFVLKLKKKHTIDVPFKNEPGFIRIKVPNKRIEGLLMEVKMAKTQTLVKVLAFTPPQRLGIDKLNEERKSTIPKMGKLLGMVPHIVALVCLETEEGMRVAPQLDGMGVKENPKLIKELLLLDDTLVPESILSVGGAK